MKLVLFIILIVFYANSISGLSPELRQKLVDTLNENRRKVWDEVTKTYRPENLPKIETITYDIDLEKAIDNIKNTTCYPDVDPGGRVISRLVYNSAAFTEQPDGVPYPQDNDHFFHHPRIKRIGCSATIQCHYTITNKWNAEKYGKTAIYQGMCMFDAKREGFRYENAFERHTPQAFEYGALIGIPKREDLKVEVKNPDGTIVVASSSERILASIFLIFLVLYV